MRYTCMVLTLLVMAPFAQPAQKQKKPGKKAAAAQVLTGCMDEKPEGYVLRSEEALKELAQLEPVGLEKAIFARYVGNKVSVSGELVATTDPPTLKVSSPGNIKQIAEICAPPGDK